MSDYHANALADALRRVGSHPSSAVTIDRALRDVPAVTTELRNAVIAEVPEFSKSRNPDLLPELTAHGLDIINEIVRLLRAAVQLVLPLSMSTLADVQHNTFLWKRRCMLIEVVTRFCRVGCASQCWPPPSRRKSRNR